MVALTLAPIRLVVAGLLVGILSVVILVCAACRACCTGRRGSAATTDAPMPCFIAFFRVWVRLLLYCLGFWWITVKGNREASVRCTVSNHCSMLDSFCLSVLTSPSFVAKAGLRQVPIVAPAASLLGCIFVPQRVRASTASTASKAHAPSAPGAPSAPPGSHGPGSPTRVSPTEVPAPGAPAPEVLPVDTGSIAGVGQGNRVSQHRPGPEDHFSVLVRTRVEACAAASTSMPALHVFPEGTTSNGTAVASFRTSAFLAGLPVQPCVITYPGRRFTPTWETIPWATYLFRLFTQFSNAVTVTWLPPYIPGPDTTPSQAAEDVRLLIARAGNMDLQPADTRLKWQLHSRIVQGELPWKWFKVAPV